MIKFYFYLNDYFAFIKPLLVNKGLLLYMFVPYDFGER